MFQNKKNKLKKCRVAFVGSVGVPNKYGGFEAFIEHCGPEISKNVAEVLVTCDAFAYEDRDSNFRGMKRIFVPVKANGGFSIFHDGLAFLRVFKYSSHIIFLGVSGGLWFPIFRLMCDIFGKKIIVNIDGVEWRRSKFGVFKRAVLWSLDSMSQAFSHKIIYDNPGLCDYILKPFISKARFIAYSGDHILKLPDIEINTGSALTICRIEPENNLDMLIEGALNSNLTRYTVVGNWNHSLYGKNLYRKYKNHPKLNLLGPIYDEKKLAVLRQGCEFYLHGHSVGGTNPSLVEMLFYDCKILCFDVNFNRYSAGDAADYFKSSDDLNFLLSNSTGKILSRVELRKKYSCQKIANEYLDFLD